MTHGYQDWQDRDTRDTQDMTPTGFPLQQEPRRRHRLRWALVILLTGACAAAAGSYAVTRTDAASRPAASPAARQHGGPASPAASPAPVPSPAGTYRGSCDYLLANGINGRNYLIGEIDMTNTGNVGVKVRARITWPQEGAPPVTATRRARLPYGAGKVVRFKVPVGSYSQGAQVIGLLQSWQEHHNFRDGCHYDVSMGATFGAAH